MADTVQSLDKGVQVPFALRALDWTHANLDLFEPFRGDIKPDAWNEKALVELALLCSCLHRQRRFSANEQINRFIDFIAEIYERPLCRERIFRAEHAFVPHTLLIASLRACGRPPATWLMRGVQSLIERSGVLFVERFPYRTLEVRHLLDMGGFAFRLPSYRALSQASIIVKNMNPIYMTQEDAYSITHALFYVSDFGARPVRSFSRSQVRRIHRLLEQLLGMYIYRGDWDLVGELLLSCHCLRWTTSPWFDLGWEALCSAQHPDGAVPGPTYEPKKLAGIKDMTKKREYVFKQCYHTTLVATLAGALCADTYRDVRHDSRC